MKISQLAKLSELSSKTIRYYEEINLIPKASRNNNGYREFSNNSLEKLIFIRRCRDLQIPLEQIKQLLLVQMDKTASCQAVDNIIKEQLTKVRKARQELALLEESLSALALSCQKNKVSECVILNQLTQKN